MAQVFNFGRRKADRTHWAAGPWDSEPDQLDWKDPVTGYLCAMRRGPTGAWNGYVAVPTGHPAHGLGYDNLDIDVHGGLTFADGSYALIEHLDNSWWFGFDCHHAGDLMPYDLAELSGIRAFDRATWRETFVYRNMKYVRAEIASLVDQLRAMESKAAG